MAGKSKADGLTLLKLKSLIAEERCAIEEGSVKPPRKIACGFGLQLWVKEDAMYWRLPYRYAGKQKLLALGVCSQSKIDLADARARARDAKDLLAKGIDPCQARINERIAKEQAAENTFEAVALEWHAKELASGSWIPSHAERVMKRLKADLFPTLGKREVSDLKTKDLLHPLRLVIKREAFNLAKSYRQYITAIMRYAVQTGRIDTNPALDLQGAIATRKTVHRPALPLTDLPSFLQKLKNYEGLLVVQNAVRFALLTGARSSEFRFARWDEFDLSAGTWTIPEKREAIEGVLNSERGEKMNRERVIYLSTQVVSVVEHLYAQNGRSIFVFQGRKSGAPISENTVNVALQKMGYDTSKDVCLHGFRTMMVSGLNESLQFTPDAIERHIGHEGGDRIRSIYNRNAQYLAERQRMLQWWADYLDVLMLGQYKEPSEFKTLC
ncbi:tyrosine-type recombinase/integrase [Chitinibacter sp. S2-10]|uniref:tyrosine-type recombinase/integrase n=1 Tax=Chitinibacter sp. S2-10 TaxID=3373597 RepID=UPI0039774A9C